MVLFRAQAGYDDGGAVRGRAGAGEFLNASREQGDLSGLFAVPVYVADARVYLCPMRFKVRWAWMTWLPPVSRPATPG